MDTKLALILISALFALSACTISGGPKGIKPSNELIDKIKNDTPDNAYYIFREKRFGGSLHSLSVVCNDELFELAVGEFIECLPETPINYIGVDIDQESGNLAALSMPLGVNLLHEALANIGKYNDNFVSKFTNAIYTNKLDASRFVLASMPSPFKDGGGYNLQNTINKNQALELIERGYKLVSTPKTTSPIFRYTAVLNPYSSADYKFFILEGGELPHMKKTSANSASFLGSKQGVVIYSDSDVKYPAGIWLKNNFIGSLKGQSYIFVETSSNKETLYTYSRGDLRNINLSIKDGEIKYVKLDSTFRNLSDSVGKRSFSLSTKDEFMRQMKSLNRLEMNVDAAVSPSISQIEIEGIDILNELVRETSQRSNL
jgi:hypothetical protein